MGNTYSLGFGLFRAVAVERILTVLTRFIDGLMIWFLAMDPNHGVNGVVQAFVVVTPVYFAVCLGIVYVSDVFHKKGVDMTGLEELRELEHAELKKGQWIKRLLRKVLMSKRLIFWVGSWFYLDPDYVTLLLREREAGYAATFLAITLPSVVLSMTVWLGVYWAAFQGYKWAVWLISD